MSDLAIYDNAYWLKAFQGNARQLFRIPPEFVQIIGGDIIRGPSQYLIPTPTTAPAGCISPHLRIVHIHGYSANDTRVGVSPLVSLKSLLAEEFQASRHRTGYWANAARKEGIIERPLDAPALDETGMKRLKEGWEATHRGIGGTPARPRSWRKARHFVDSSFSPKDSEFIPGRQFVFDTVATAYNIPLALLSRSSTPTFASMKEFHKALYVDVLGPVNAKMEQAIWLQLIPDFDDPELYVEFNIEEKLQGDFESTADAFRSHVQVPDMSVNESRKIRNLPPLDDPSFDEPAKPANYSYAGQPGAAATPSGRPESRCERP